MWQPRSTKIKLKRQKKQTKRAPGNKIGKEKNFVSPPTVTVD
jgi:hypothetical protein